MKRDTVIRRIASPKDLVKKEPTRNISLRVKERTMVAFEKYAHQNKVTASSIINGVLDSYIALQEKHNGLSRKQSYEASKKVMRQYLDKMAGRVATNEDEDLLSTVVSSRAFVLVQESEYERLAVDEVMSLIKGVDVKVEYSGVYMCDFYNIEFYPSSGKVVCLKEYNALHRRAYNVPADKYPVLAFMLVSYLRKFETLYLQEGNIKDDVIKIDLATLSKIIEATNSEVDREEYAKRLAEILSCYEPIFAED